MLRFLPISVVLFLANLAPAEELWEPLVREGLSRAESLVAQGDSENLDWRRSVLADAYRCAGDFDHARRIIELIPDSAYRDYYYSDLASQLAREGEFDSARQAAAGAGEQAGRAWTAIADAYGRGRQWDEAVECLQQLGERERPNALLRLAVQAAPTDRDRAVSLIELSHVSPSQPEFNVGDAMALIDARLAIGDVVEAKRLFRASAESEEEWAKIDDYDYVTFAAMFARHGKYAEAFTIADSCNDSLWRSEAKSRIVEMTVEQRQWDVLIGIIRHEQSESEKSAWRSQDLCKSALDGALAASRLDVAERIVREVHSSPLALAWSRAKLASAQAATGKLDRAKELAELAAKEASPFEIEQSLTQNIHHYNGREWAIRACSAIAAALLQSRSEFDARPHLDVAERLCTDELKEDFADLAAIAETGRALRDAGRVADAAELLKAAVIKGLHDENRGGRCILSLGAVSRGLVKSCQELSELGRIDEVLELTSTGNDGVWVLLHLYREQSATENQFTPFPDWFDRIDDPFTKFFVIISATKAVLEHAGKKCD